MVFLTKWLMANTLLLEKFNFVYADGENFEYALCTLIVSICL